MKRTKQAQLTAALFAAALGISSAGSTVSAADLASFAAFSPDGQRIAAVLYGPPPISGDVDGNRILDARDLTLMKRYMIAQREGTPLTRYEYAYYAMDEYIGGTANTRTLLNMLTGMQEPVSFTFTIHWVPYLSTEVPETEEERLALKKQAEEQCNGVDDLSFYYSTVQNDKGEDILLWNTLRLDSPYVSDADYDMTKPPVSFTAVPDAEHPERTTIRAKIRLRLLSQEEYERVIKCYERSQVQLEDREPSDEDYEIEVEALSRIVKEDGTVQYFNTCEVEYDVLTGRILVHDSKLSEDMILY